MTGYVVLTFSTNIEVPMLSKFRVDTTATAYVGKKLTSHRMFTIINYKTDSAISIKPTAKSDTIKLI